MLTDPDDYFARVQAASIAAKTGQDPEEVLAFLLTGQDTEADAR